MGISVGVTRAAVATVTGNQDFTDTGLGGLIPKAAYFIVSYATADGTAANHAMLGIGAVSGAANRWAVAVSDEHSAAISDTYVSGSSATCVRIISPIDGTVDGEADFVSFIANGVRINWSNAPSAAFLMTVVLFAGSDLTAHANTVALGDTLDNAVDVTAPGFRPDVVLTANVPSVVGELSWGMVQEDGAGTVSQRSYGFGARDNITTMTNWAMARSDSGVFETSIGGGIDWWGEFGGFDASGFTVTTRNAGANSTNLYYLALDFGGAADAAVASYLTPLATGNDSSVGVGFKPQFMLMIPHLVTANNGTLSSTAARAHSSGLSAMLASVQFCTVITSADDLGTADTQSLSDNVAISLPAINGTLDIEATLVSFDSTGFTFNFTNVATEAKRFSFLAIEEVAAGVTVSGGLGTLVITELTANVVVAGTASVVANLGALALAPLGASVVPSGTAAIAANLGAVGLTPLSASVVVSGTATVGANLGSVTLSGLAAAVVASGEAAVSAALGSVALTGLGATVVALQDTVVGGALGSLSLTPLAASVVPSGTVAVLSALGTLTLTGLGASVVSPQGTVVVAALGSITLTGLIASVAVSGEAVVGANAGLLTLGGQEGAVVASGDATVLSALGQLALEGLNAAPSVSGSLVGANLGVLALNGLPASVAVSGEANIAVSMGLLVLAGVRASIFVGIFTTPGSRTYVIGAEDRVYVVAAEERVFVVAEDRTYMVATEERVWNISEEDRTYSIGD